MQQIAREASSQSPSLTVGRSDNFACRSPGKKPIVLLHGLFGSPQIELNEFEAWMRRLGYCTFAPFYGSFNRDIPILGGLKPIAQSSKEIAAYIRNVLRRTGAAKIDLVGHSEGALQVLYGPKFDGYARYVDNIVAIAPPTHGTDLSRIYNLVDVIPGLNRQILRRILESVGCGACDDLIPQGEAVTRLNDGRPIVQYGNTVTIITSRRDEIITPVETAFVNEPGVRNLFVQDYCPRDISGHLGEVYDYNVWQLARNAIERNYSRPIECTRLMLPVR
ncbi:secreted lipase [Ophiocordyceps camponoti-floridani]|uniref:Secreted lipase n=1 Tax=Ophiocordyceps camponoti-floridani TaxID=2030778 RepID=A0A8H4Q5J9_9HYPO|nr:secreted lipase [Ophiocordyceps camponoti-floridani]